MGKPLVSFVVPVLNGESHLAKCLLSLRNLDFPTEAYEVWVMDNGSTDHTHKILKSLGFAFQVVPKVSISSLRNRAAKVAQGEYLAFVDSDVEVAPQWLKAGLAAFREREIVAVGCIPGVPSGANWVQQSWDLHQTGRQCNSRLTPVSWLSSMNLIVRREDFLAVSGFAEQLQTAEDVDLCYRLGRRGTLLYHPGMQAVHWGEARDLRVFWRKEVWRGMGNLKGVLSHGFRWDELPSLGYPLYVLYLSLLLGIGLFIDLRHQQIFWTPLFAAFLILPALCLALSTSWRSQRFSSIHKLFLLYFVYGCARAWSVTKSCVICRS
jgi:glycosyltransferase involved in cell wall biosynthesis